MSSARSFLFRYSSSKYRWFVVYLQYTNSWYFSGINSVVSELLVLACLSMCTVHCPDPKQNDELGPWAWSRVPQRQQTAATLRFQYFRTEWAVFTELAVVNPSFCGTVLNSVDSSFTTADQCAFTASDFGSCHYQHDNTAGDSFGIHFVPWPCCW